MRADFSRDTFDQRKQYVGVLLQQGRVLTDADWNEQVDLTRHRHQQTSRDVVGPAGAPRDGGGFAVGVTPDGKDLTLSPGRIYIDGLAVDNDPQATPGKVAAATTLTVDTTELDGRVLATGDPVVLSGSSSAPKTAVVAGVAAQTVTLTAAHGLAAGTDLTVARRPLLSNQPYAVRPAASATLGGDSATPGRYAVVLHARLHGTTVLDDPLMAEPALGGPDTSARVGVVWRAALARVGAVGSGTCSSWVAPAPTARLRPSLTQPPDAGGDCALPAEAGYRGVRNSLYRVEVAELNTDGTVKRLLWDADNGSVAAPATSVDGSTVHLSSFGPQGSSAFSNGRVVTVEDETTGWVSRPALVRTVQAPNVAKLEVELDSSPGTVGRRPRLRRWGGVVNVTGTGPVVIDQGLRVQVTGTATVGAYWLIPARSALAGSGDLQWPAGSSEQYAARPPHGPTDAWTTLTLVDFDGTSFKAVPGDACRTEFPSLTTITADDVSYDNTTVDLDAPTVQDALEALAGRAGACTVVLKPTENWAAAIAAIPAGAHARLCFTAGEFTTSSRVVVEGKGHVVVEGIGPGTLVRAKADEVALAFVGCASVTVRDLCLDAGRSARPGGGDGLGGALTVTGSPLVSVERVTASCAGASLPLASCVSIAGTGPTDLTRAPAAGVFASRAIVRDCSLSPGEYQVGLSIRDMRHVDVSGVVVSAPPSGATQVAAMSGVLRRRLRGAVIAGTVTQGTPGGTGMAATTFYSPGGMREVAVPGLDLLMQTPAALQRAWLETLTRFPRTGDRAPRSHLLDLADEALLVEPTPRAGRLRADIDRVVAARTAPSWQGIVIAGQTLGQLTVRDCRVSAAIQGIHVGASRAESSRGPWLAVERVQVTGNTVSTLVPPEGAGARHGIYVGNASAALVADNMVSLVNQSLRDVIPSRGIAVAGYLGPSIVVRDNTSTGFPIGVSLRAFGDANLSAAVRWVIRGNTFWASTPKNVPVETAYKRTNARAVLVDNLP